MKPTILFICLTSLLVDNAAGLRTFSLEDLIPLNPMFYPERISLQWLSGSEYMFTYGKAMLKHNMDTDTTTTLLDEADLAALGHYVPYYFSADTMYLLLMANKQKVYRYSSKAEYAVYNMATKTIQKLGNGLLQVAEFGANNSLIYAQNNNVYYVPEAGKEEIQLTTDGKPGEIYNGVSDWIYEEEVLSSGEAMWSSPDGTYLAVASFNDTNVASASFPFYGKSGSLLNQYSQMVTFKYPKAGCTNPTVSLQVFNLKDPAGLRIPFSAPAPTQLGSDVILARVNWPTNNTLLMLWLNRRQNLGVLTSCLIENDQCNPKIVKEYKEMNGWIDKTTPMFDSSGKAMFELEPMPYEAQRYMHATRLNFNSGRTKDLTPGNSTVQKILGYYEENDELYLLVAPGTAPWLKQLWTTKNGKTKCITCNLKKCNNVTPFFSEGAKYAVIHCNSDNVPPSIYFYKSKDKSFELLKDNAALAAKLAGYNMPMSIYNMMPLNGQLMSLVKLLLPPKMEPGEKYPMIVKVYAGPGTNLVKDSFELDYSTYLTTNRSIIVALIDVRGSDALGVDSMFAINNALGTLEITDTLLAIKRIVKLYPFIDKQRVGVWGWSYGGFASTMMLIKDEECILTCGAAVAPVTSWLYYDSIYTERYMDTPQANEVGYNNSNLMLHAEKLRGKKYLLVHGTLDDNVHYQNSMQLAKTLQHADIPFDQMSYTDENHSLLGVSRHFYHMLDRFWTECFQ